MTDLADLFSHREGSSGQPLTMSSREVADLVESRHDSVKRTIERLADRGVIVPPPMVGELDQDAMGRPRNTHVYRLDKRSSLIVVAQLSPEFTARVVDRWQELEVERAQPARPNFADPATAARAWADQVELLDLNNPNVLLRLLESHTEHGEKADAQNAHATSKLDGLEALHTSKDTLGLRLTAKSLSVMETRLVTWLIANGWAFRQKGHGPLRACSAFLASGHLQQGVSAYERSRSPKQGPSRQLRVTMKGFDLLNQYAAQGQI